MNLDSKITFWVKFLSYKAPVLEVGDLTLPEPNAAIVPRGGKHRARDIPAHSPHLGVVVIKLCHNVNFKLR